MKRERCTYEGNNSGNYNVSLSLYWTEMCNFLWKASTNAQSTDLRKVLEIRYYYKFVDGALCSEERILSKERALPLATGRWTVPDRQSVFVCLGTLVTGQSNNVIYDGGLGHVVSVLPPEELGTRKGQPHEQDVSAPQ